MSSILIAVHAFLFAKTFKAISHKIVLLGYLCPVCKICGISGHRVQAKAISLVLLSLAITDYSLLLKFLAINCCQACCLSPEARTWLADKGFDSTNGMVNPVASMVRAGNLKDGHKINIHVDKVLGSLTRIRIKDVCELKIKLGADTHLWNTI